MTEPKKGKRKGNRVPESSPAIERPILERVHDCFLQLLTWSEKTMENISRSEETVSASQLDSLVKALTTCAKELPRLEVEISRGKAGGQRLTKEEQAEFGNHLKAAGFKDEEGPWSENDEVEYLQTLAESRGLSEDYLRDPGNSETHKALLRQFMQELEMNPQVYDEGPKLQQPSLFSGPEKEKE
jgi:hypothetical protein